MRDFSFCGSVMTLVGAISLLVAEQPGALVVAEPPGALAVAEPSGALAVAAGCTIWGTYRDDELTGTEGPDVICAFGGDDIIYGLGGDDIVYGGPGDDEIHGGPGDDVLRGKQGSDRLFGDAGNDDLGGTDGDDFLDGGEGDDLLNGADGDDVLLGGLGKDRLFGGLGEDVLFGGFDPDDVLSGAVLSQDQSANVLGGGAGWDRLIGASGDDFLYFDVDGGYADGRAGDDRIVGPPSSKTEDDHVIMFGGEGDDLLIANRAGDGTGREIPSTTTGEAKHSISNYFDGGGGQDMVFGSASNDFIDNVDGFVDAKEGNDTILNAGGRVVGGEGDDYLSGSDHPRSEFIGGPGADTVIAPGHYSTIRGGTGPDVLDAKGLGSITIWPGSGDDVDEIRNVVHSDQCYGAEEDIVKGLCTP